MCGTVEMVLSFLFGIASIIAISPQMEQTPRGRRLLNICRATAYGVTYWRAGADNLVEIMRIREYLRYGWQGLFILAAVGALLRFPSTIFFTTVAGLLFLLMFADLSFEWVFEHRKAFRDFIGFAALLVCSPLLLLAVTMLPAFGFYSDPGASDAVSQSQASVFGSDPLLTAVAVVLLVVIMCLSVPFLYAFYWVAFITLPILTIAVLYGSSLLASKLVTRSGRNVLKDCAWIVLSAGTAYFIIGKPVFGVCS